MGWIVPDEWGPTQEKAFLAICEAHRPALRAIADKDAVSRVDADDCASQAILKTWQRRKAIPLVETVIRKYLHRTLINIINDLLRRKGRAEMVSFDGLNEQTCDGGRLDELHTDYGAEREYENVEIEEILSKSLSHADADTEKLVRAIMEGHKVEEAAVMAGLTHEAAKTRLFRFRRRNLQTYGELFGLRVGFREDDEPSG